MRFVDFLDIRGSGLQTPAQLPSYGPGRVVHIVMGHNGSSDEAQSSGRGWSENAGWLTRAEGKRSGAGKASFCSYGVRGQICQNIGANLWNFVSPGYQKWDAENGRFSVPNVMLYRFRGHWPSGLVCLHFPEVTCLTYISHFQCNTTASLMPPFSQLKHAVRISYSRSFPDDSGLFLCCLALCGALV